MPNRFFFKFSKIVARYKGPIFQLGVYFQKNQIYTTLIENRGLEPSNQIIGQIDARFKIIDCQQIEIKSNQNSQLFALNTEDSKESFQLLVDSIAQLKSKILQTIALKSNQKTFNKTKDYLKVAIALPENSFFFKTIGFEKKDPSENLINQKLQAKVKNSRLDINIRDYHYDFIELNQSSNQQSQYHFCLIKQQLIEKLTSAFDLNQMRVELITIGDYLKSEVLFDCAKLENNQIGAVIKISLNQLYFLSHHSNFGIIQLDRPLWLSNQNLTENLIDFIDYAISSNSNLKAITALMIEIDSHDPTLGAQKTDCLSALDGYLKEYYPDCTIYDVDELIEPTDLNINQLIALKAAAEVDNALLP